MEILEIKDIVRKDVPLYYRNKYTAVAEIDLSNGKISNTEIEFAVEVTPISGKVYTVETISDLDYPTMPVKKALIEVIKQYDREGKL